jgi:AraC-like DNA-binding protein
MHAVAHADGQPSTASQGHRTMSDIAFSWGFSDLSHFGRSFKKAYGISASEYRNQTRK